MSNQIEWTYREDRNTLKLLSNLNERYQCRPLRGAQDWFPIGILHGMIPRNQPNEWWLGFSSSKSASLVLDLLKCIWRDAPEAAQATLNEVNTDLYFLISNMTGIWCDQLDHFAMHWPQLKEYLQHGGGWSALVHALVRVARLWTPKFLNYRPVETMNKPDDFVVSIGLTCSLTKMADFLMQSMSNQEGLPAWTRSISEDDFAQLFCLSIRYSMAHVKLKMDSGWQPVDADDDKTEEHARIIKAWIDAVDLVIQESFVTFFPSADDSIWLPLVPLMLQSFQMALDLLTTEHVEHVPLSMRSVICSVILGIPMRLLPAEKDLAYNPLAGSRRSSMPSGLTWQLKCAVDAIRFATDPANLAHWFAYGIFLNDGAEGVEAHAKALKVSDQCRKILLSNSLRLLFYLSSRSQPCKASTKQVWEILTALEEAVRMLDQDTRLSDIVEIQRCSIKLLRFTSECADLLSGNKTFSSLILKILSIGLTTCKTMRNLNAAKRMQPLSNYQPLSSNRLPESDQIFRSLEISIRFFDLTRLFGDAPHKRLPAMWTDALRWQISHLLPALSRLVTVNNIPLSTLLEQEQMLLWKRQQNAAGCEGRLSWQLLRDNAEFCHGSQDFNLLIVLLCALGFSITRSPAALQAAIVTSWQYWATLELAGFIIKSSPEPFKITTICFGHDVSLVHMVSQLLFYTMDELACEAFDLKDYRRFSDINTTQVEALRSSLLMGFSYAFMQWTICNISSGSIRSAQLMEFSDHTSPPLDILSVILDGHVWDSLVGCIGGDTIARALTGVCLLWAAAVLEKLTSQIRVIVADLIDLMAQLRVNISQVLLGGDDAFVAGQSALALLRRWVLIVQTSESNTTTTDSDAPPTISPLAPNSSMMVLRDWEVVQCELLLGLSEEVWGVRPCSNPSCNRLDGPCELEVKTLACGGMCGARYCCRECQAQAWRSGHRENCSLMREMCQRHRDIHHNNA